MTTATFPSVSSAPVRGTGAFALLSEILGGIADGLEMARRYDRLNRMSTSELASLGLNREDIASAAVNGVAPR